MQMAAYIAKFAAIFVWFVWLCSNVQIVSKWTKISSLEIDIFDLNEVV